MVDKYCSKESKEIKYQENRVKEPPLEDGMQSICKKGIEEYGEIPQLKNFTSIVLMFNYWKMGNN